jgi:acyl-CoA reductase-like NAD-dependent aldehyde dehydrogenase
MIEKIKDIVESQNRFFKTQKTKDINFRIEQLKILKSSIINNESLILKALSQDLKKNEFEAYTTEIGFILNEINKTIKDIKSWVKPTKVSSVKIPLSKSWIKSEPLGKVLIISPWNYPFQLALSPLIGAIAAGNTSIIKPSEISKYTSQIIKKIINENFNEKYIAVIEGNAKITQQILTNKFDYIFYTGSETIGKIIMASAAKYLTPVTLELGGKSPCVVDTECDIEKTARRITSGKFMNAGQTCIAPDYILVNLQIKDKLILKIKESVQKFYSQNPESSKDYGRIINTYHFNRLMNYLTEKNSKNKLIYGGNSIKSQLYIEPTILEIKNKKSQIMQEEIFGPILPIIGYTKIDDAIEYINSKPKPLALYIFSENEVTQNKIINETSSGGVCINDTILQVANSELPFGGVGNSGFGRYHGKASFDTFSNFKSILKNTTIFEIPKRYPPFHKLSLKIIKLLLK